MDHLAMSAGTGDAISRSAFPHYHEPYRGLPAEIRLHIWRYAFAQSIEIDSPAVDHNSPQHRLDDGPSSSIRWKATFLNLPDFNFAIFVLNKKIHAEAKAVARGRVMWVFVQPIVLPGHLGDFFSSFGPVERHITRGFSVGTAFFESYVQGHIWAGELYEIIPSTRIHELELRIILPPFPADEAVSRSVGYLWQRVPVSAGKMSKLRSQIGHILSPRHSSAMYDLLMKSDVRTVRIAYTNARDELRPILTNDIPSLIFGDLARYDSTVRPEDLLTEIEWPMGCEIASIRVTKKRPDA